MVTDFNFVTMLSLAVGFAALGTAILIAHNQSKQSNRIEKAITDIDGMTTNIHTILDEQQATKSRLQTEYARGILFLLNLARMEVHGLKVQMKFLKLDESKDRKGKYIVPKEMRMSREKREEFFKGYLDKLQKIMTESKIEPKTILELFDESTMLKYEKMWKMFVYAITLLGVREKYHESLMQQMIDPGVEASKELHEIFIKYIPEFQKKGYRLMSVEPS